VTPRAKGWLLAFGLLAAVALPADTPPARAGDVYDWAAARRGVSAARLRCLGYRESRHQDYPPVNGRYWGRMQFDRPTWAAKSARYGWAGSSPHDPWAAVDTAAATIADGEGWRWPPLRWC
jgi:hypothetical protein